jgi:uncharacterized protein (TIGR03437 family)
MTLFAGMATAQTAPFIYYRGIVNAASFHPQGLPSGLIARGSLFTIFGRNLGPAATAIANTYPVSEALADVSVRVFRGNTSVAALPVYVSPTSINAIMPSNAPLGAVSVQVTFIGQTGNPSPARVTEASFGFSRTPDRGRVRGYYRTR